MNVTFPYEDLGVPNWLPGETLYSLASRYHLLSGNSAAHQTAIQLFGHRRRGYQHDFPTGIDEFARRTNNRLGSTPEIIRNHTLLPFYLPFRTALDAANTYAALSGAGCDSLKFQLGILTSRFRANHPLKACQICMEEDRAIHHVAYWHLEHQFPGVWVCLKHDTILLESAVKSNGVGRYQWILPEKNQFFAAHLSVADTENAGSPPEQFFHLAKASIALASLPNGSHLDIQKLLTVYHQALEDRNLKTPGGSFRLKSVIGEFVGLIAPLRTIRELSALPANNTEALNQIARLLRQPRSGTHPLRHLVLILWLFGTWKNFWDCYRSSSEKLRGTEDELDDMYPTKGMASRYDLGKIERLVGLIRDDHYSATKAAKVIGVDVATAMAWAARAGITIRLRPKTVSHEMHQAITRDLQKGLEKQVIAEKHIVSIGTVTRILRTVVGLQQARYDARLASRRKQVRALWEQLTTTHPNAGTQVLRTMAQAEYAWLHRNDRDWLSSHAKQLPKLAGGNHASVQWDCRDEALSHDISKIVLELNRDNPNASIPLWKILQKLPELQAKLSSLDRLPLTRAALAIARRRQRKPSSGTLF